MFRCGAAKAGQIESAQRLQPVVVVFKLVGGVFLEHGASLLGGHAVAVVGYDDAAQVFIVRNSWGTGWGMAGYFTMPYAYFETLASDFWTIRQ